VEPRGLHRYQQAISTEVAFHFATLPAAGREFPFAEDAGMFCCSMTEYAGNTCYGWIRPRFFNSEGVMFD
jgi:hypothetical protein